jgi:hypothetical protein
MEQGSVMVGIQLYLAHTVTLQGHIPALYNPDTAFEFHDSLGIYGPVAKLYGVFGVSANSIVFYKCQANVHPFRVFVCTSTIRMQWGRYSSKSKTALRELKAMSRAWIPKGCNVHFLNLPQQLEHDPRTRSPGFKR